MEEFIIVIDNVNTIDEANEMIKKEIEKIIKESDYPLGVSIEFQFSGISEELEDLIKLNYDIYDNESDIKVICQVLDLVDMYNDAFKRIWGSLNLKLSKFDIMDQGNLLDDVDYEFYIDGDYNLSFYCKEDCSDYIIPAICYPYHNKSDSQEPNCMFVPHPNTLIIIEKGRADKLKKYEVDDGYIFTFKQLLTAIPEYNESLMDLVKY
jgi:hypothetical protein